MDIFNAIAEKDNAKKQVFKTVRLWQVSLGNGRITSRLYTNARAKRLAAKYNRITGSTLAYVAGPLKVTHVVYT